MLYFYSGTDREKARDALDKALAKVGKKQRVVRISDANAVADLSEALRGSGMFGGKRVVVLDGVLANEEMRDIVMGTLPSMKTPDETFFILEGKLDAETRKKLEKHAETSERFDSKKEKEGGEIFALAFALKRGDKKALWVGYQRALQSKCKREYLAALLFFLRVEALRGLSVFFKLLTRFGIQLAF